jgi:hypothetical protein
LLSSTTYRMVLQTQIAFSLGYAEDYSSNLILSIKYTDCADRTVLQQCKSNMLLSYQACHKPYPKPVCVK